MGREGEKGVLGRGLGKGKGREAGKFGVCSGAMEKECSAFPPSMFSGQQRPENGKGWGVGSEG